MFTWIQKYFQRHFGIICALILVAMGVPLIVIFAPSSGIGQGDRQALTREVFGYNLGNEQDKDRLFGDASLSATLQLGYSGISGDQLQQYALQRAAAISLANEKHIPTTTPQEITEAIKDLRIFQNQDGTFDANRYASFRDSLKAGARISETDVSRVIAADVRADKIRKILAGPGYVLPADVAAQLIRLETIWTLSVATVDYKKYSPDIEPNSEALAKFFGENSFRYEIGPRVSVDYIHYPASDYLGQVSVTEDELRAFFNSSPARFNKPAVGDAPAAPATSADFDLVHGQVEAELKLAKARELATKVASDLTLAFYESKISHDSKAISSFLAAHNAQTQSLTPFTSNEGPAELGHSADVTGAAFKLDDRRFYSDAIPVQTGAVVLLWKETLPSRMPLMTEVLSKVKPDYIESQKRSLFVTAGKTLKTATTARLKAGEDFATAIQTAAKAAHLDVTVKSLSPFTATNPPESSEFSTYGPLETLSKGEVSDMIIADAKGTLVYAADKQLPDTSPTNPKYEETRKQIAMATARMGASKYLDEMVRKELARTEPKLN